MSKKPWAGRFQKDTDSLTEEFTQSIDYDKRLYRHDIKGSIAHCRMLKKCKIITSEDADKIEAGLKTIQKEIEDGTFVFDRKYEDIHMNIEKRLIALIGDAGGVLHTARSRNDQVALDIRLFLKDEILKIISAIQELQSVLLAAAQDNIAIIMPGYTHLKRAQPVLFSHHMLAYYDMLKRDSDRFTDVYKRTDVMPLGSCALAGTSFPIDRQFVASELSFEKISTNSIDSVSDRDFAIEFCSASSIFMMHLSRLCEEIIIWNTSEFNFIELDDAYCTGSSIMPQKKNPDICELVRGKTGRIYGNLTALLTLMKGLPLAYNRDMQEDKEPLFDTSDTVLSCARLIAKLIETMKVNKQRLKTTVGNDYIAATEIADYLARGGLPFRDAHEVVGKIVAFGIKNNKELESITIKEYKQFSPLIGEDIYEYISIEKSVNLKNVPGGTGNTQVLKRIKELKRVR